MIKHVTKEKALSNSNLIVPIAYDLIFKEVFGKDENSDITALLISSFLDIPYEDIKGHIIFKNNKMSKNNIKSKKGESDIVFVVDISKPLRISLEMNQFASDDTIIDRNIFYYSDIFASSLEEGESYSGIPITIQFNFNTDYVDSIHRPIIDKYYFTNKYGEILSLKSTIYHINVAKMSDMWYSNKYKEMSISPIAFLISALIMENEKNKFLKLLKSDLLNKEMGEKIERIVLEMNNTGGFPRLYYDYDEEWHRKLDSVIDGRLKKIDKENEEKLKKIDKENEEKLKKIDKENEEKLKKIEKELESRKQDLESIKQDLESREQKLLKSNDMLITNMYNNGLSVSDICKYTNKSLSEIKKILNL